MVLQSDEVYLEAQLGNLTTLPLVLERVSLEPAELYSSEPIEGDGESAFSYLSPGDTRQFLYKLSPKPGLPPKSLRGLSSIGKLDMVWRTGLGERGRLQTSALQRMAPGTGDVRLSVHSLPARARVRSELEVVVQLQNASERELQLWLELDGGLSPALLWTSRSKRPIGVLAPAASLLLPLRLLPLSPGLHWISGLRLTDSLLNRTYELDEIAQIFVHN